MKIVVDVKDLGLSHVLELWLVESKGMLPVKYLCSNKDYLMIVEFHGDLNTIIKWR